MLDTKQPKAKNDRRGTPLTRKELAAHHAKLAEERRLDKQAIAERAKAAGMKKVKVRAEDGSIQEVWAWRFSYLQMGFQDHQVAAAELFSRDYESAHRGVRAASFEPSVDGGANAHAIHIACVTAQERLCRCKAYVGERNFTVAEAVVIFGATSPVIHRLGGREHRVVKHDMELALNAVADFYHGNASKDRTWAAFERHIRERREMIEAAERSA